MYRRLLHTYGVATFDRLGVAASEVITEWPILISSPREAVQSLAAIEAMTGRRCYGNIGDLPRQWFDDHELLEAVSRGLHAQLFNYRNSWNSSHHSQGSWIDRRRFRRQERQAQQHLDQSDYGELPGI